MKKIIITITIVSVLFLALIASNVWAIYRIKQIIPVVDNQASVIVTQRAAWAVLLSSLSEEQKAKFAKAMDEVLKVKQ